MIREYINDGWRLVIIFLGFILLGHVIDQFSYSGFYLEPYGNDVFYVEKSFWGLKQIEYGLQWKDDFWQVYHREHTNGEWVVLHFEEWDDVL